MPSREELTKRMMLGPEPESIWTHYKGGTYQVVTCAIREATLEVDVIYKSIHNKEGDPVWSRPLAEWFDEVVVEGFVTTRFYR